MFFYHTHSYYVRFDAAIYDDARVWIFAEVAGTLALTFIGLLSLWLVWGRGHWFIRAIPLALLIAATMGISAYDLGWVALIHTVVVAGPLGLSQGLPKRFELRELMLVILSVSLVLGYLVQTPIATFESIYWVFAYGIVTGLVTLAAAGMASSQLGWRLRLFFVLMLPYAALLVLWLRLAEHAERRRGVQAALVGLALLYAAPVIGIVGMLFYRAPLPVETPAENNGFADLHAAAEQIPGSLFAPSNTSFDPATLSQPQLQQIVDQVSPALGRARAAMKRDCHLTVDYSLRNPRDFLVRVPYREGLFNLSCAMLSEAQLALEKGETQRALDVYTDILRLAECEGIGGLPFDTRLGYAIEDRSFARVYALRAELTADELARWVRRIRERESTFESGEILSARRWAWVDRIARWQDRLVLRYLYWTDGLIPVEHSFYARWRLAKMRLLATELALEQYRQEHGSFPEQLEELAHRQLKTLPLDPYSGQPLRYQPRQDGFLLYSVNLDGEDDSGRQPDAPWAFNRGDLTLQMLLR